MLIAGSWKSGTMARACAYHVKGITLFGVVKLGTNNGNVKASMPHSWNIVPILISGRISHG